MPGRYQFRAELPGSGKAIVDPEELRLFARDLKRFNNELKNQLSVLNGRYIALGQPKQVEPIAIDLERPIVNATVPVKWLPGGGALRVEIMEVEGRKGHALEPSEPAEEPIYISS